MKWIPPPGKFNCSEITAPLRLFWFLRAAETPEQQGEIRPCVQPLTQVVGEDSSIHFASNPTGRRGRIQRGFAAGGQLSWWKQIPKPISGVCISYYRFDLKIFSLLRADPLHLCSVQSALQPVLSCAGVNADIRLGDFLRCPAIRVLPHLSDATTKLTASFKCAGG